MSRPARNDVDYFPFLCKEGLAMEYINNKYANDGYATWIRILRELAVKNFHYLDLSDEIQSMTLTAKCRISEAKLIEIITDLVKLGEFDRELWEEKKVIYSQKFIDSIKDAYKKRSNPCIDLNTLKAMLSGEKLVQVKAKPEPEIKTVPKPEAPERIVHSTIIETLFAELPNTSHIETIAMRLSIPKEKVLTYIPGFRKAAELSYPTPDKFYTHFKNWIAKQINTSTDAPKKAGYSPKL